MIIWGLVPAISGHDVRPIGRFSLSSRGLQKHQATQMMFLSWQSVCLPNSLFYKRAITDFSHNLDKFMGVVLGIFCSGLAYIAWYDGLQAVPASQVGAFLYIEPLVAVLVAWVILREDLLPISLVGGAIILFGVRLVQKS
jgi:drug/metabolite transporter (DMT)-like permease